MSYGVKVMLLTVLVSIVIGLVIDHAVEFNPQPEVPPSPDILTEELVDGTGKTWHRHVFPDGMVCVLRHGYTGETQCLYPPSQEK